MPNEIKSWSEISSNFDPMMPADLYDNLRLKYFSEFVAPKVGQGKSVEATWAQFKELTNRKPLLGPGSKALLHMQLGATAGAAAMMEPLKGLHPEARRVHGALTAKELELTRLGEREGMNTTVARVAGSLTGQAIDFGVLSAVLGPEAAVLAKEMTTTAKGAELVTRALRGGLSFATYDTLSADGKDNRLMAGLKGFATGAGLDLALGMPGYLRHAGVAKSVEEAEELITSTGVGKPKSDLADAAVSKKAVHDAEIGRLELRPERGHWSYTLGQHGSRVYVKDVAGQVTPIDIRPGREYETYRQVRSLVEQGGSVSHYEVHPDEQKSLNEFIRIQTNAEEAKYRGTVIRTPNGQAEEIAKTAKGEGLPAEAVSNHTVEVATVPIEHPILNKPEESVVAKVPERKPSEVEIKQVLDRQNLESKTRNFLERQVDRIWDPNLEYEEKRAAIVIAARHVPELLPEHYRARLAPFDPSGRLVKEVAEARVNEAADKALGYRPNIEHIARDRNSIVQVNVSTRMTENEIHQLENALGPNYQINIPAKGYNRAQMAKLLNDEELDDMLQFHNVMREEVDIEAIREGGQTELIRQLEVKKPELYGKKTSVPKAQALVDWIPRSEQRVYTSVKDGIKAEGDTHASLADALDASGDKRLVGNPAGRKSVGSQVDEATLKGRLLGSIEDVGEDQVVQVAISLKKKGYRILPLKGYQQGKYELVYFRAADLERIAPLIDDYDQYISRQAGRVFDTDGRPVRDLGQVAHDRLGKAFGIPLAQLSRDMSNRIGGVRPAPEIARKPYGSRLVLQVEDMAKLYPSAEGLAHPSFDEFAKGLGLDLPPSLKEAGPIMILTPESSKGVVYHERLHVNGMHAGTYGELPSLIPKSHRQTALELATGLGKYSGYKKIPLNGLLEEAFVHAATAVRFADKPYLEHLARYDKSVGHVFDFVGDTANALLERSFGSMDSVPVRIYQRTLWDLMRRTSPQVSEALKQGLRATGSGIAAWYEAASDSWVLKETPAGELRFKDINQLWDFFTDRDKNFMAPSMSLRSELGGIRGPLVPGGSEPTGGPLPVPEIPPEGRFVGASAASALWRPFFPWLATLHENMNALFRKQGRYLPLYETAKKVDEQFRLGDTWIQENYSKVADLLKPFKGKKMSSVFDYLTHPEVERTTKLMEKYGLTQPDAINAHKVWEYMLEFRNKTDINLIQYMVEYHPKLRGFGWAPERVFGAMTTPQSASYWDKLIRHEGKWDPQDANLGRFLHVMLREGMEKKFTGNALNEFEKLIGKQSADGTYVIPNVVRWPLVNYGRYMRGIPDVTQQAINKGMSDFFGKANERIKQLNTKLPKALQIPAMDSPPRQVLNRFMLMSYAMGLGMRPAIMVRDMMQAFTGGMTVLGPARFTRAFTRFMSAPKAAFDHADAAGALLRKHNIGELYGDIMQETPTQGPGWMDRVTKWSNSLMAPSRWGHNFGRAVMFEGEYHDAVDAIRAYRAGRQSVDQLLENTSLWFMDRPAQSSLLRDISNLGVPVEDAATKVALEAVDLTQWAYRRGTQPTLLRYGAGRIFGQYGVWPANYADFLYRIGKKWTERPHMAARTSGTWAAVNYALASGMNAVGADTSKWFWQSPAGFAGSPHWDLVQALMVFPENTDEGHAARKTILEYPLNFVPAMAEMKAVARAVQEGGWNSWPPEESELLRVLGFKPVDDTKKELDWDDFVKTQLGYEQTRRRR